MNAQPSVCRGFKRWTLLAACAAAPIVQSQTAPVNTSALPATATPPTDDVVQMTPFEVNAGDDHGYQATTTLSGTRLNSKLDDLAASLSVVTKQQLVDTAAVDINDIFKYELNTEGTAQWTSFNVDRGVVRDDVSTDPQGATRMRGLTSANIASNGFGTSLPFDTYDVDAVEISRGPNSTVFGLGNTGGGVNLIRARANATRDVSSITLRGDSYDGYRGSFDVNRVVKKDVLAVRVLGLYDDRGYVRKPSTDVTRRLKGAVLFRPLHSTTITASFESYRNTNNRPNALTPRDTITDWVASGKPTWDPISQTVHLANGTAITNVTTSNEATLLPYGLALTDSGFTNSPNLFFDENGTMGLFTIGRTPSTVLNDGLGPNNVKGSLRLLQNSNFYARNSTTYPLYNPLQITNQSLYDWTSINLSAPNFIKSRGETSTVQLEQSFLKTERNTLALQASWLRERISTRDRRFLGNGAANLQPFIDVNEKLLDGSVNPYFLRTYVGGNAPSLSKTRNNNDNYRATLAYELDLSRERNFLRWLGRNRFSGFGEYREIYGGRMSFQDTIVSDNSWMSLPVKTRDNSTFRTYPRYYVGDANGQNVDYAPARAGLATPYTYSLRYYNVASQQWVNDPTTYGEFYDANRWNRRLLSTYGGTWQGFFLDGRVIPLLGLRKDYNRSRDGNSAISPSTATNGFFDTSQMDSFGQYDWVQRKGKTDNQAIVVKPLKWLNLTYSQSNSFNPGSAVYDVWGLPLPDPRGKTKDYGFEVHLFDNRLVVTAKQYETIDIGRSTSDLNTIVQRAIRMDRKSSSGDPGLTDWYRAQLLIQHPDWTEAQLTSEALVKTGADYDYLRSHINKTHGDASNSYSRGKEVEITYNPNRFWTMRLTGSQSIPINGIMSPAVQEYITSRWNTWQTITDPISGKLWWTNPWASNTIPRDWYTNNVLANLKLAVALQGKRRSQTREYHVSYLTNYQLAGLSSQKWLRGASVGGAVRWEAKGSIGFYGAAADPDGVVREYDPNRPVWDKEHYYFDFNARYKFKFYKNRVGCTLQLNVNNAFESGRLQPLAVNPDGNPWAFRIIDPRQFILTATFEL
jgi:outer membrane receptor protein involved in Fe transport